MLQNTLNGTYFLLVVALSGGCASRGDLQLMNVDSLQMLIITNCLPSKFRVGFGITP